MQLTSLSIAFPFLLFVTANSQTSMRIGFKAGIDISNPTITNKLAYTMSGYNSKTDFSASILIALDLSSSFSLRSEPGYVVRGARINRTGLRTLQSPAGYSQTLTIGYLEIPVLMEYRLSTDFVQPYIVVGPSIGLRVAATSTIDDNGTAIEQDAKDDIEPTDLGLHAGAGILYPLSDIAQTALDLRYYEGFRDIDPSSIATMKFSEWRIGLAVLFSL